MDNIYTREPETRFYAVKGNLDYFELADQNAVDSSSDLIAILKITIITISWAGAYGRKTDSTREIEILNSNLEPLEEFQNNSWKFKISHLVGIGSHNNKSGFAANFIDALEIHNKTETFVIAPEGFIAAYKRFLELSKYTGYRLAVVQVEREKLLTENGLLKEEILKLKGDVARLTEKLSYLA